MLTVTDKAATYLRESLSNKQEGTPDALRIVYSESDGYQLTLDNPKDGDQLFEQDGQSFLVVDSHVGEALSDATLDVQESPQGASLMLTASATPPAEEAPSAEEEPEP